MVKIFLVLLGSFFLIRFIKREIEQFNASKKSPLHYNTDYIYHSINYSYAAWLIIPFFLILDFLVLIGSNIRDSDIIIIILPTLIGGGAGAFLLWIGNKDKAVYITKDKLFIQVNQSEIREFNKSEIQSYRVSKDGGKTLIRISSPNKNEFELTSYFLNLNGFEEKLKQFLGNEYVNRSDHENMNSSKLDFTEQLLNLAKLKDAGILTKEEFEEQKYKILNSK